MNKDALSKIKDAKHREQHPFWIWESILSIPRLLSECLSSEMKAKSDALAQQIKQKAVDKIVLTGTGSSYFASIAEKYFFEAVTGIRSEAHIACELLHYPPMSIDSKTAVFFHSHSGSTMGDPEVVEFCKHKGAYTIGVTDVADSALSQHVDEVFIGPGGKKMELPAARTYATAIYRMMMLAVAIAKACRPQENYDIIETELRQLPDIARVISERYEKKAADIVESIQDVSSFFFVGAGANYATSDEAALGFYQSAGVPAQAFEIENFIHGPMQTLRKNMGVIAIAPPGPMQTRVFEVAAAVKMIGAKLVLLAPEKGGVVAPDVLIEIPAAVTERLSPIAYMIPLWHIAYHFALLGRGGHPDKLSMELPGFKEAMLYLTHQTEKA